MGYNKRVNTQDILNVFLIIGIIVITGCILFSTFYFIQALRSIIQLAEDLNDATQSIKNKIQMKALATIPALLITLVSKVLKRRG